MKKLINTIISITTLSITSPILAQIDKAYSNESLENIKSAFALKENEVKQLELELVNRNEDIQLLNNSITYLEIAIVACILILIITTFLYYKRLQNFKKEYTKLTEHQQDTQKNAEDTEHLLAVKNKELTSNTLQLIERDDLLDSFCEYLKNTDTSKEAKSLITTRKKMDGNNWELFNQRFTAVNKDFYERLQAKYPDLTLTDLRHCALIKLNFSGKEMSNLLGISEKSAHMARYRIRKKLKLDTEINLSVFLGDF